MTTRAEKISEILGNAGREASGDEIKKPTLQELYSADKFDFEKRPLSYSRLKHILKSPLHFAFNWFAPYESTPALVFGSLFDCLLFRTEEDFKNDFIITPDFGDQRSPANREKKKLFLSAHSGKTGVTQEECNIAEIMVENVKTNPKTKWLYEATDSVQQKIYWTDPKTKLRCIMILDATASREGKKIIWDAKTAVDASRDEFQRTAINFDYPMQSGTYVTGYAMNSLVKHKEAVYCDFYHVVSEKTEPYPVNTFRDSPDFIELGKQQFRKAMDRVKFCKDNDCFWMGYEFMDMIGYEELDLPGWVKQKHGL